MTSKKDFPGHSKAIGELSKSLIKDIVNIEQENACWFPQPLYKVVKNKFFNNKKFDQLANAKVGKNNEEFLFHLHFVNNFGLKELLGEHWKEKIITFYNEQFKSDETDSLKKIPEDNRLCHFLICSQKSRGTRTSGKTYTIIGAVSFIIFDGQQDKNIKPFSQTCWLAIVNDPVHTINDFSFKGLKFKSVPFRGGIGLGAFLLSCVQEATNLCVGSHINTVQAFHDYQEGPIGFYYRHHYRRTNADSYFVRHMVDNSDHYIKSETLIDLVSTKSLRTYNPVFMHGKASLSSLRLLFSTAEDIFIDHSEDGGQFSKVDRSDDQKSDVILEKLKETIYLDNSQRNVHLLSQDEDQFGKISVEIPGKPNASQKQLTKYLKSNPKKASDAVFQHLFKNSDGSPILKMNDYGQGLVRDDGTAEAQCFFLVSSMIIFGNTYHAHDIRSFCSYIYRGMSYMKPDFKLFDSENIYDNIDLVPIHSCLVGLEERLEEELGDYFQKWSEKRKQKNEGDRFKHLLQKTAETVLMPASMGGELELLIVSTISNKKLS